MISNTDIGIRYFKLYIKYDNGIWERKKGNKNEKGIGGSSLTRY
jgi:hypothetical protein